MTATETCDWCGKPTTSPRRPLKIGHAVVNVGRCCVARAGRQARDASARTARRSGGEQTSMTSLPAPRARVSDTTPAAALKSRVGAMEVVTDGVETTVFGPYPNGARGALASCYHREGEAEHVHRTVTGRLRSGTSPDRATHHARPAARTVVREVSVR